MGTSTKNIWWEALFRKRLMKLFFTYYIHDGRTTDIINITVAKELLEGDIEEFGDDFSVVLRGASLCLHLSSFENCLLRLKSSYVVRTTWVLFFWRYETLRLRNPHSQRFKEDGKREVVGVNLRKMMPPLATTTVNCQKEDKCKMMPLERLPPEEEKWRVCLCLLTGVSKMRKCTYICA